MRIAADLTLQVRREDQALEDAWCAPSTLLSADSPGWKPTGASITGTHARPALGAGGADLGKHGHGVHEKDDLHRDEKVNEA